MVPRLSLRIRALAYSSERQRFRRLPRRRESSQLEQKRSFDPDHSHQKLNTPPSNSHNGEESRIGLGNRRIGLVFANQPKTRFTTFDPQPTLLSASSLSRVAHTLASLVNRSIDFHTSRFSSSSILSDQIGRIIAVFSLSLVHITDRGELRHPIHIVGTEGFPRTIKRSVR